MKHHKFVKSLQTIKRQLLQNKPKRKQSFYDSDTLALTQPYCICTDSNGESKYLYYTEKELTYLLSSTKTNLKTYPCPYEKGWHLTKSSL
ncbi:MAG: hypothetical protein Q9M36_02920 [Sulfurovum sp.]|nr:hypothetical protein [Sulfurovum sp.]